MVSKWVVKHLDSSANLMNGFISNARIIKGTGIYTSRFTPPTAPLTNVTNTKLLCCQSNTSATEAAVTPGGITANGDAAATNFNPFITDIHTVRGQETGYATLNPLIKGSQVTLSDGNLSVSVDRLNWQITFIPHSEHLRVSGMRNTLLSPLQLPI